ncbi:SRPBCC family protein [Xanthobacter sp. KR7-225]|uniref:SRPBCC family protein n=1 Tax=Xanthobacter sp. KR7-225 TaxID=3156613 RepID=UPI0032B61195
MTNAAFAHATHGAISARAEAPMGVVTEAGAVRFERRLKGPLARVWAHLTQSDLRAKWLAAGTMEPAMGGAVALTFENDTLGDPPVPATGPHACHGGTQHLQGRVTAWEPERRLGFTFGLDQEGRPASEVLIELEPEGDAVRMVLTHRRLADRAAMLSVSGGWHAHLHLLAEVLADQPRSAFWTVLGPVAAAYDARLPA